MTMQKWLRTRGSMLAGLLVLTGLGWLALSGHPLLATWWVLGPVAAGLGAVLFIWAGMINAGWFDKAKTN